MTDQVHAKIRSFLQEANKLTLTTETETSERFYNKAGVLPFVRLEPWRFLLVKPMPKHSHLEPPAFQICKGTRMQNVKGKWRDVRDNDEVEGEVEDLATTALREGMEELGLKLDAIISLIDMGPYTFSSSVSGDDKYMWLFGAEITSPDALAPMYEITATTADRSWMTESAFMRQGREDHRDTLSDMAKRMQKYYRVETP